MGGLLFLLAVKLHAAGVLPLLQCFFISLQDRHHQLGVLITRSGYLLLFRELRLDGFEVLELQFGVYDFLILNRIDSHAALSYHVVILEAADDMDDGIALTDVAKELVAQPFTL